MNGMKRIVTMLVALAMIVTSVSSVFCITAAAAPLSDGAESRAAVDTRITDDTTLDGWEQYFGDSDNSFNTRYTGHVWTDKSVTTDASKFAYATELADGSSKIALNDDQNNFLVALSAMAASKSVTGMDNKPTDTMIVLDMSSSMYKDSTDRIPDTVVKMIDSVNKTIKQLQELNVNNRVGVTIYYGGPDLNQAPSNSYQLWLPLDRYKHKSDKFLVAKVSGNKLSSAGVNSGVTTEAGKTVSQEIKQTNVTAGTYMQQGILSALEEFMAADTHVPDNAAVNAGEARTPIMVIMSDGKPTAATNKYTNLDTAAIMGSNREDIRSADETDFLTQLTAAYAKAMMDYHYAEETPLFYTLSLGDKFSYTVMDPSGTLEKKNTAYESKPATVSSYWNKLLAADSLTLSYKVSKGQWNTETTTRSCTVSQTTVAGKTFPSSASQQYYVDKAFEAAEADELEDVFDNIFKDISLQTHTYPTLVDGDENLDGYISFVDKIGEYMNVTDVKGVLLGEHWYSGKELSKNFVAGGGDLGTVSSPKALGDELVWSIQQRLGLSDSNVVRTLLGLAYQHGQLAYSDDGSYSNYVGWYSDAQGNYLGFWQDGLTNTPANATHTNKSYIYLGETDDSHGVKDSDMMYTTARVRHEIATGVESVSFAVPAALIPMVEYDVEFDENDNLISLTKGGADHPIRLVYEVALDDSINEYTIGDVVDADYIAHNTDTEGYVNFYTNQYEVSGEVGYNKVNTYSYFRPSHANENYYYQSDEPVYTDQSGTFYNNSSAPDPKGTFYREITVYSKSGSTIKAENIYRQLSEEALKTAQPKGDGTWYIPKGNVHVNLDGYTIAKEKNKTDTLENANLPYVDVYNHNVNDVDHRFIIGDTLGNNGKVKIKAETGIKLTKIIENADAETNMDKAFEFTIETDVSVTGEHDAVKVAADGTETAAKVTFSSGKATVTLKHGESMYILGLTDGLEFTITETKETGFFVSRVEMDGKTISETAASGKLDGGQIAEVEFINEPRGEGVLTIAKQVEHTLGANYNIPDKSFTVNVKLEGTAVSAGDKFELIHSGDTNLKEVILDSDNSFVLTLKNGEQAEIKGIPEGTKATVTETNPGTGFTVTYKENGVSGDGIIESIKKLPTIDNITVVNTYNPVPAEVKINLSGVKTLIKKQENGSEAAIDLENWDSNLEFQFIIQKYVLQDGTWQWVDTESIDTASKAEGNEIDFLSDGRTLTFEKVGTYGYQVIEKNHGLTVNGITYDATMHTFDVIVTDADMDGKLEAEVKSSHGTNNFVFADGVWTNNQINFTNRDNRGKTSELIMIKKNLTNASGSTEVSLEGYEFELYESDDEHKTTGDRVLITPKTDAAGETYVYLEYENEYTQAGTYTYYYTLKEKTTGINAMTDSDKVYNFKVSVTANDDGSVTSEIIGATEDTFETFEGAHGATYNLATFTNVYEPDIAKVTLDVKKKLNGRNLKDGDFKFLLKKPDGTIQTVANKADGTVPFDTLTFDKVGTYEYTVIELIPEETEKLSGVTYDETVYDVIITVKDNNGKLEAAVDVLTIPGTEMVFENEYQPPEAKTVVNGTKALTDKKLVGGMFTFVLAESDENGNVKENGYSQRVTNDDGGNFEFSELKYNANGTHYYVVSEDVPENKQGINYDTAKYLVKIDVAYNAGTGVYDVSKTIKELGKTETVNAINFENKYEPNPITAVISGVKVLQGRDLENEQFEFNLYAADDNWTKGNKLQTVKNDADDYFTFENYKGCLEFKKAGTYKYIVNEVNAGAAGYTYDEKEVGVIITVTDNLVGRLDTAQEYVQLTRNPDGTVTETPAVIIGFENHYVIEEDVKVKLYGEKSLTDKELKEGDFTFVLKDVTNTDNPVEVATVKNDAQGKFEFELTYTAADMNQTYTYMIEEVIPDDKEGIIYDENSYTVVVKVIDNGDGTLVTKTFVGENETDPVLVNFENKYSPDEASAVIKGEKNLKGRSLKAEEFEFSLIKGNKVVETVKNKADGSFTFTTLTFDKAGTYRYTVVENNTKADRIIYDKTEYKIVIKVTDKGGFLEAEVTVLNNGDEAKLEFNNEYTPKKPTDPNPDVPFTGDNGKTGMYLGLLVCSLIAIAGIVIYRRKRR